MVVFVLLRIVPGDPAAVALGINATPEAIEAKRAALGTDRPLIVQYLDWVGGLWRGHFGISFTSGQDLSPMIWDRTQVSLILVICSMVVALLIAVPLGTYAAVRHRHVDGMVLTASSQLGIAIPGFLFGILLVGLFAVRLRWFPANGWVPPAVDFGAFLARLVLPVFALASVQAAIMMRYVRSAVLEVMHEDFLRTARAKGLSRVQSLVRHGLRNAAIPVITVTGVQMAFLVIGAVVIERVFVIPGLGSLLIDSIGSRDLMAVQSVVMMLVLITIVINLLVDLTYTVIDPRLRET